MIQAVRNAFRLPDLRRKVLITFGILVIYRLAAHVPVPGVDAEALRSLFATNELPICWTWSMSGKGAWARS